MLPKVIIGLTLATGVALAQGKFGTAPAASTTGLTTTEEFVNKLKLDEKTQIPKAENIFNAAARQGDIVGKEMNTQRKNMLDAALSGNDESYKLSLEAYTVAAQKMAAIEAAAFSAVYSDLKPSQTSKAVEAFALITGFFQPAAGGGMRPSRGGAQ